MTCRLAVGAVVVLCAPFCRGLAADDILLACASPGCDDDGAAGEASLSLLQRRAAALQSDEAKAAAESTRVAIMHRFLAELHAQGLCDDGEGDLRMVECAADNCRRCLGSGAVLLFNPGNGPQGRTVCTYQPRIPGAPSTYCGEAFRDTEGNATALEDCRCCRGEGATLKFDASAADGIGYTYCEK
eukprot:CAMPEP_0170236126 /NCGR_PEP_ID=MMETSP0116_2-20130129/17809_1 /TAXON_ID=400756 /ORGANISM="Durinskia baltica, Strain CSIRO CS-38" /LENGTH=185 /DNA_ID=CAMNT_0010486921 /DNA_START=90 /DNA_END=647 /DNA_ORIENTATION=+